MILPNLTKRESRILYLCIGIIVSSLLYGFVLEPVVKRWTGLNSEIKLKSLRLERNLRILSQKDVIEKGYDKLVAKVKAKGSDEEEIASLLTEIEALARKAGVRLIDMKPRPAKDMGFYKKYVIEIDSEALIGKITNFIYQLQNSPQLLKVEKLHLTFKGGETSLLRSSMSITKIVAL